MTARIDASSDGPAIAYDIAGEGPTVIFLHGIGGNRTNWHPQFRPVVATGFRAVAWDARGYGDSDDYDGPLHFTDFSRDLRRLVDHLQLTRAHFCGLSMGGRILFDFYRQHSACVETLILCDTFAAFDASFTPDKRAEFVRLRKQPLLEGKTPREMAPAVAKSLLGPNHTAAHFERLVESMAALHKDSYIKTIEATTHYDNEATVGDIDCPTLLVYGEHDTLTPPAIGKTLNAAIKTSRLEVIADAGHLVNIEQPDAFNRCLVSFLVEHRNVRLRG
ncbi:MAG: alpha/beta fold hydrolase [Pseudomonadota bacterium]